MVNLVLLRPPEQRFQQFQQAVSYASAGVVQLCGLCGAVGAGAALSLVGTCTVRPGPTLAAPLLFQAKGMSSRLLAYQVPGACY